MHSKSKNYLFTGMLLLTAVLLFTIVDHYFHGLKATWSVPDYYFKDKIPFGFFWAVVGYLIARKVRSTPANALIVSGVVATTLQVRYFLEGYPKSFVFIFLFLHLAILFVFTFVMFAFAKKKGNEYERSPKSILIAFFILIAVGFGTYYSVFSQPAVVEPDRPYRAPVSATTKSAIATEIVVHIKNFAFVPKAIAPKAGTKVTWINDDSAPHTATSDGTTLLDSGTLEKGQSFSFIFTKPLSVEYHCNFHPSMTGTVSVGN